MARYGCSGPNISRPFYVSLACSVAVLMLVQFYVSMTSDNIMRRYHVLSKGGVALFTNPYEGLPSEEPPEETSDSSPSRPPPPVQIVDNAGK